MWLFISAFPFEVERYSLNPRYRLVHTGMGRKAVENSLSKIEPQKDLDGIISVGFATSPLPVGYLVLCREVFSLNLTPSYPCHPGLLSLAKKTLASSGINFCEGNCLSVSHLLTSPKVKREVIERAAGKNILAIDMESYWVACWASQRNYPFLAVRAISDTLNDTIPQFDLFLNGKLKVLTALSYFIQHPIMLYRLAMLIPKSLAARKIISRFTKGFAR